ncbi:MAG: hypothetical protein K2I71_08205, partial [Helicobacter sp.]|nr:hypothetical protein [Helicobacter sp.]
MKKIVFLGAKEIGRICLEELFKQQSLLDYTLIAVGTSPRGEFIRQFCQERGIPLLQDLEELLDREFDILLSVQYHQILKQEIIDCAREIAFNLHLAPLPEYRGCNQFSFAILNGDKEFGVSIHKIDSGIDSGDIAFQKRFLIPKDCFVEELVELANFYGAKLFREKLPLMIAGCYDLTPQQNIPALNRE